MKKFACEYFEVKFGVRKANKLSKFMRKKQSNYDLLQVYELLHR